MLQGGSSTAYGSAEHRPQVRSSGADSLALRRWQALPAAGAGLLLRGARMPRDYRDIGIGQKNAAKGV